MTDELVKRLRAVDHMSLEDCFCQSSLYDQAADRIEQLTAERDRYRKALEGLMVHEPDYSDTLWQDAREALNGETP